MFCTCPAYQSWRVKPSSQPVNRGQDEFSIQEPPHDAHLPGEIEQKNRNEHRKHSRTGNAGQRKNGTNYQQNSAQYVRQGSRPAAQDGVPVSPEVLRHGISDVVSRKLHLVVADNR